MRVRVRFRVCCYLLLAYIDFQLAFSGRDRPISGAVRCISGRPTSQLTPKVISTEGECEGEGMSGGGGCGGEGVRVSLVKREGFAVTYF